MGVAVAWQGKGVGSRLLGELLDIADNWMNLRRVELTVYTDNAPALALYRKFGFETEGEMRDYAVRMGASWMFTAWRACGGSRGGWGVRRTGATRGCGPARPPGSPGFRSTTGSSWASGIR